MNGSLQFPVGGSPEGGSRRQRRSGWGGGDVSRGSSGPFAGCACAVGSPRWPGGSMSRSPSGRFGVPALVVYPHSCPKGNTPRRHVKSQATSNDFGACLAALTLIAKVVCPAGTQRLRSACRWGGRNVKQPAATNALTYGLRTSRVSRKRDRTNPRLTQPALAETSRSRLLVATP